jgi:hypothetical protein
VGDSSPSAVTAQQYSAKIESRGLDVEVKVASLANHCLKPVMPEGTQRYNRRSKMWEIKIHFTSGFLVKMIVF